uniref:Uncharacterized protein n=1 Tax=Arundo donax TaxID=35708 RepID=A0A0A9B3M6_ARUDO
MNCFRSQINSDYFCSILISHQKQQSLCYVLHSPAQIPPARRQPPERMDA